LRKASELAQALRERVEVHLRDREDVAVGLEGHACAALGGLLAARQRRHRHAALVALAPDEVVAVDLQLQPLGEEVDYRHADAVQTAGDFVGVVVELPAGVQLGHDDLGRAAPFFLVDVDRDAAAVVFHGHGVVGVDGDQDAVRVAGQRLVDGVVDHLVHHVVQAGDVIGVADVHAGALAHGVEAFEDLDVLGRVVLRAVSVAVAALLDLDIRLLVLHPVRSLVVCHRFAFLGLFSAVGRRVSRRAEWRDIRREKERFILLQNSCFRRNLWPP
jgi:hypothetical protein